ncbi:MAG: hydroxymethylbilane synthase [Sulfolobaceae archaeon]
MKIRIASRGSQLSKKQVEMVGDNLRKLGIDYELVEVKTKADLFPNESLYKLGKGVFEKEVNEAVLRGEAEIAVHSMKDILTEFNPELEIFAVLERDPPYDILIADKPLAKIESNAVIGTSSIRRRNFTIFIRPDLNLKELRGNVDSRIRKYLAREYDGIILAEASIRRLGININYYRLDIYDFTPEPNQGIIVIIGRKKDNHLKKIFREINHQDTLDEALAERAAISVIGGGCHSPIGILFRKEGKELFGIASYANEKKKISVTITKTGDPIAAGLELGKLLAREMKNEGIIP